MSMIMKFLFRVYFQLQTFEIKILSQTPEQLKKVIDEIKERKERK